MLSQKVQYTQKVEECESLRTVLPGRFATTPSASSTSQSTALPPSSRVVPPTSFPPNNASRLGFTRSASVAPTPPTRSVAPSTNRSDYAGPTITSSIYPLDNLNVPTVPSHSHKGPISIGAPAGPVPTQTALGADRSGSQGVSSPLMNTPGNAGIGAGGRPPLPADSSVSSDTGTAFPYRAKAWFACACQNSLAFAFDLTMYYRYRTPR
jgi:hypothetical protein